MPCSPTAALGGGMLIQRTSLRRDQRVGAKDGEVMGAHVAASGARGHPCCLPFPSSRRASHPLPGSRCLLNVKALFLLPL